ncbi:hypothetical protein LOK49_LG15G00690 [Camellia lanceoleosa]|uniref:Uncharacterized protein n=1 Tax=Camellia lanceoleosa TaxID=1840588 RepID=A0ACC0F5C5_9ERIC|nr:hypothetical protein LOK49_LG15G00690 [Camellia lanceoleosa]
MDHSLQLLSGHCGGRLGDSDQRLATMSVCCAVLISCFVLWRLWFVFSTSMLMSRLRALFLLLRMDKTPVVQQWPKHPLIWSGIYPIFTPNYEEEH